MIDVGLIKTILKHKYSKSIECFNSIRKKDIIFEEAIGDITNVIKKMILAGYYNDNNVENMINDIVSTVYIVQGVIIGGINAENIVRMIDNNNFEQIMQESLDDDSEISFVDDSYSNSNRPDTTKTTSKAKRKSRKKA